MKIVSSKRAKYEAVPQTIPDRNVRTYAELPEQGRGKRKSESKRKVRIVTLLLIVCILFAGAIGFAIRLNFHISSLDTIFPNVWVEGVSLSGMTQDEAIAALIDNDYEANADNISITLIFPDESSFVLTGNDVGLSLSAAEAVEAAFSFGRDRDASFLQNEITFVRSTFGRVDLENLSAPVFNFEMLSDLAAEITTRFNESVMGGMFEYDEHSITIVKGSHFDLADFDEVYELARTSLFRAVEENDHIVVHYFPTTQQNNFDLHGMFVQIDTEPVSSSFIQGTLTASPSSYGRTFNLEEAIEMLDNAMYGETVVIPIIEIAPEVTQEEIEALILRDVLAESTTSIAGSANRLNNITLSAQYVNETIFHPGEEFSFNGVVGRRTEARGFRSAPVFQEGRLVDGIGGGICQTSSTIYDALLRTTLEVTQRRNHSRRISYLPLGFDATVFYGQHDLRFRNNMDFPIKLEAIVEGTNITVRILGTNIDGIRVEVETEIVRANIPFQVVEQESDELLPGERVLQQGSNGINGAVVDVFQLIYDRDGNLIERVLVGRDTYQTQTRVYLVGPRDPEAEDPPEESAPPPPPEESPPPPPPEEPPPPPPDETEPEG